MFSVVIPLYNKKNHIARCVESVLHQTLAEFEVIVVNDGSTDGSLNELRSISDARLKVISQNNQGVSVARNTGMKAARFRYIAFLDADDVWAPSHLKTLDEMVQKYPDLLFYSTSYTRILGGIEEPINHKLDMLASEDGVCLVRDMFRVLLHYDNIAWTSVLMVNAAKLPENISYRAGMRMGEDLDFLLRASIDGQLCFSTKITAVYDHDAENRACKSYYKSDLNNPMLGEWYETYRLRLDSKGEFVRKVQASFIRNLIASGFGSEVRKTLTIDKTKYFGRARFLKLYVLALLPKHAFVYYRRLRQKLHL